MEMKLYARVFIYNFLLLLIVGGAGTYAYSRDFWTAAGSTALYAMFFGTFMATVLGSLHIRGIKKVPGWKEEDFASLKRTRAFTINLPYGEAYDLAAQFLNERAGLTLEYNDREKAVIIARAPMSWNGFGMTVKMDLNEEVGKTRVNLLVKPVLPTAFVDQGESLALAVKIERGLSGTV